MTTKTLSQPARNVISQYLSLSFVQGSLPCPYFNNRRIATRGNLRVLIGKGTPSDIITEAHIIAMREHIDLNELAMDQLRNFLIDHNLGIDCSGLTYYILNAELKATKHISLAHNLHYPKSGFLRKLIIQLRPVENISVKVLADEKNSQLVEIKDIEPGDIIIMIKTGLQHKLNHVLLIHQVDFENKKIQTVHYTHAIQWQIDGKYNHSVRQGIIEITDENKPLIKQKWIEQNRSGENNYTLNHAKRSKAFSIRRIHSLTS